MKLRKESDVDVHSLSDDISKSVEKHPPCSTRSVIESSSIKDNMNNQNECLPTRECEEALINNGKIVNPSVFCNKSGEGEFHKTYSSIDCHLNDATSEECNERQVSITATTTLLDFTDNAEKTVER
jgi:hypothetical protein